MQHRARGYAMVASAAATWGTWSLFFRPAERAQPIPAALEAIIVLSVVVVGIGPFALLERRREPRPRRAWLGMLVLGVGDAMNVLFFFWAMQRTSIAIAVLSHYLAPVLIALAAPFVLGEKARRSTWFSLVLALSGLALLLEPWRADARGAWVGASLGAASAVFYAGNTLVNKRMQRWFSARELMAYHAVPSVLLLALFVPPGGWSIAPAPLALVVVGGIFPGALAGLTFVRGLFEVPASRASVLTLLEPLVAVVIAAVVWNEVPGPAAAVGAALILSGAYVVLRGGPEAS